ncbi:MAG: hypothetical protein KAQ62_28420, partial [Cyclobacteriaceae bacterium]|nr:hypothetical protein [Cyclobacteriaceae bacterium]
KAVVCRLQINKERANEILDRLYVLDNTSAFVANERIINGQGKQADLSRLITNELPAESYLTLALKYKEFGLINESINVLKAGPKQAVILLWLAYLDVDNHADWLKQGLTASPNFVFPYRTETYEALMELMKTNNDCKLKYYASLILWKKDLHAEAKEFMLQCGDQADFTPFYLVKAKLFDGDDAIVKEALAKAGSLDAKDWRVNLALIDQYMKDRAYALAAKYAKSSYAKNTDMSILGMRYADALLKQGQYKKGMAFLEKFEILPFEGAVEGRHIYHETAIRLAFEKLKKKDYKGAIQFAEKAKIWPKNLGTGKPYNTDERLENSIISYCFDKMGNKEKVDTYRSKVISYRVKDGQKENPMLYLQFIALNRNGNTDEAEKLIGRALKDDPGNEYILWIKATVEEHSSASDLVKRIQQKTDSTTLDSPFLLLIEFLNITQN